MYTIRRFTGKVLRQQKKDILKLVEANVESITLDVFTKESPLYNYLAKYEMLKIEEYLNRVNNNKESEMCLIVAEKSRKIIGYLLYHENTISSNEVAISSSIVSKNHRKKGVLTKMINHLKDDGKSIGLSCSLDTVDLYTKLGFKPDSAFETHVAMTYGTFCGIDKFISIDDDWLVQTHSDVLKIEKNNLKKLLGDSFDLELKKLESDNSKEKIKIKKYLESLVES